MSIPSRSELPDVPGTNANGKVRETWKKVLFIFNPVSGKSQIRTDLVDILEILSAKDYVITCYPTKCRGDARNLVRSRKEDYVHVICAGGDLLIFFLIMKSKLKGDVLFLDHPTDVGLAAFVKG